MEVAGFTQVVWGTKQFGGAFFPDLFRKFKLFELFDTHLQMQRRHGATLSRRDSRVAPDGLD